MEILIKANNGINYEKTTSYHFKEKKREDI